MRIHGNVSHYSLHTRPNGNTKRLDCGEQRSTAKQIPKGEKERGRLYTVQTGDTRFLIQGQLHLCLRKVHPNVRYNPSWQYGYCSQNPPIARLLRQHMRLSFASCTLQPPLLQTSPPPCHFVTSPFLSGLQRRRGDILTKCAIFSLISDPGAVALVSSQSAPECTLQSLMIIRMSQATFSNSSTARTTYAVVICDATLQRPLLQTSPSPWPSAFPLPLHPLEKGRGSIYTV